MKKKIILSATALMLIATGVSASSLNGDYKGNPIVILKSNGSLLNTGEVPAMIYDGKTMVPIAALRNLGADVTWDENTYSVDVKLPQTGNANVEKLSTDEIAKKLGSKGLKLINTASYVSYGDAITFIKLDATFDIFNKENSQNYTLLIDTAAETNAYAINIIDNFNHQMFVNVKDILDYKSGKLSLDELNKKFEFHDYNKTAVAPTQPSPTVTTGDVIESSINGDFNGWTGDTIFKLMNGQIWQQTSYAYTYHYAYSPKVTIYKDGSVYKMMVDGVDSKISVTRIK